MYVKGKRIATALFAAALAGTLAGCGGQQAASSAAASASASSADATASAGAAESAQAETADSTATITPEQAYDEIANLLADSSGYSTVTMTQTNMVVPNDTTASASAEAASASAATVGSASASAASAEPAASASASAASAEAASASAASTAPEPFEITTVYKFDISSDDTKSTVTTDLDGDKIAYYLDGKNVVAEYGSDIYGGTVEEFGMKDYVAPSKVIEAGVGELYDLGKCITNASVDKVGEDTTYVLEIDPVKYAEVNEMFASTQEVLHATDIVVTYTFGPDNMLKTITYSDASDIGLTNKAIEFSDYNATTLETAPTATKTYADFMSDAKAALGDVLGDTSDTASGAASGAASDAASEAASSTASEAAE